MASLQRQSRGITIKQRLGAFSKQNILFSLILSICVLCFSYMSAVLYEKNGERQQELNRFYQQLEIIHTDLTEYTSRDNRNLSQPILEALPQLEKMGAFLKAIMINELYRRDIDDLSCLVEHYVQLARQTVVDGASDVRNPASDAGTAGSGISSASSAGNAAESVPQSAGGAGNAAESIPSSAGGAGNAAESIPSSAGGAGNAAESVPSSADGGTYQVLVSQAFYEADVVYQAINAEFRNLYSQILGESDRLMERLKVSQRYFFFSVVLFLTVAILWEIYASRRLSMAIVAPMEEFTGAIRNLSFEDKNDFSQIVLKNDASTEMTVQLEVFNRMLDTIRGQVETIREKADIEIRLQQKEVENLQMTNLLRASELKALQMQINPHFLFNTLNLISQTAYVEGADQTSALLDSTSALLRYTLDNASREVSIYRELEILDIYVSILEKRFAGRIRFFFDLDERFHDQKVPALIFQPLVENAINHGVGMYLEGGEVHICTEYFPDRNRGRICVWDNGAGLSQDEAKEVNQRMKEVKEGEARIGLANVYARLQAFFQGRATMEIYSEPAVRTQIVIEIPVDETVRAQIVGEMPADDAIRAQIATDIPADDAVRAQIVAEMPSDDAVRAQIATDIPADEGKA